MECLPLGYLFSGHVYTWRIGEVKDLRGKETHVQALATRVSAGEGQLARI